MNVGETIEAIGWEQGCFLFPELVHQLQSIGTEKVVPPADCLYMIVTQSCDLVHHDLQSEPWCEVLQLQKIEKMESLCENGRSPRRYHLTITEKGVEFACETTSKDRFFLKRDLLANGSPNTDYEINKPLLSHLTKWLANRYIRAALPTAFNKRLSKTQKKLKRLLADHHWLFRDLYLRLSSYDELTDPEAIYKMKILLISYDGADDKPKLEIASFIKQLRELFKNQTGIDLVAVDHLPEGQTPIRLLDDYVNWDDFDYLTIPSEESTDGQVTV